MAINLQIVTSFSDKGLKSAKAAFANFKTDVNAASGAMGKFKAGGNAALNAVKANAGALALAGGAALAGFAVKGVKAFMNLALASGKFADASGLSVQEASRFIEVGDDLGIEAGTIEAALGKMNKTLGATPQAFAEARVEIARTNTGAVDVQKTFLNVVQRLNDIRDPAQRAAVASKLLGKGWQGMSELIAQGSDKIVASLKEVSDAKVITPEELFKAKELRDAKDRYSDFWDDILIRTGSGMASVAREFEKGDGAIEGFANAFGVIADPFDVLDRRVGDSEAMMQDFWARAANGEIIISDVIKPLAEGFGDVEESITELSTSWGLLLGQLNQRKAFDNLQESLDEVFEAGIKAFGGTAEEIRDFNSAQQDAIEQIADLAIALNLTFGQQNQLKIYVDTGDLLLAQEYLQAIRMGLGNRSIEQALTDAGIPGTIAPRQNGGPVSGGSSYLVGERGPEIFTPASSGMITANGAGGTTNVTVNVSGADPQAVVTALQKYVRNNGPVPVNTRAM